MMDIGKGKGKENGGPFIGPEKERQTWTSHAE
jgi:hypothetical protein